MLNFKYIDFNENLLDIILAEYQNNPVCFLFPAAQNMKIAINKFQQNWQFSNHRFVTMQEWKQELYKQKHPLLKEEKRTLAFYLSLSEEMKYFFKIHNYFQSIELAQSFFKFWEEMNEELVGDSEIDQVILERESSGKWQQHTFQAFKQIRNEYEEYLNLNNFADNIFQAKLQNIILPKNQLPIVVVNQFYFTELEKKILSKIPESIIYLQMISECFNEKTMEVSGDFGASHLKSIKTKKIKIIQTTDQQSMILSLFSKLNKLQPDAIIDFRFNDQPYSHFFSPQHFSRPTTRSMRNSRMYKVLKHIHNIISKSIIVHKKHLLPLEPILHALYDRDFCFATQQKVNESGFSLLHFFNKLADNDYQFIDLAGDFFSYMKLDSNLSDSVKSLLEIVRSYCNILTMQQMTEQVVIDIQLFCSSWEKNYTDIPKQVFTALPDFQAPADAGIITDYSALFSMGRNQNRALAISSGILKLFLDYLRYKDFKVEPSCVGNNRIKVTSLVDSRNINYKNPVILNVTEGILPQARKTPFILSENQIKQLGLKTYENIRLRDKYYFYRMLAVSENPIVFTIKNIEKNVAVSSFLEELKLSKQIPIEESFEKAIPLSALYGNFLKNSIEKLPDILLPKNEDFYYIECDIKSDFENGNIKLGFYQWETLIQNPLLYYLKQHLKLREPLLEIRADFSEKFIGNISHEIITLIWNRLIELYQGNTIHHNFLHTNMSYVDDAVAHLLKHDKQLIYKSPHNYSWLYFSKVFLPILKEGIRNFFYRLHNDLEFSDVKLLVLPETRQVIEKQIRNIDNLGLNIFLSMKADLRLETDTDKYIFDYKTGTPNTAKERRFTAQLQLYELLFYLMDNWNDMEKVHSFLFFVEAKSMFTPSYKTKLKEDVITSLLDLTVEAVRHILENGFTIPSRYSSVEDMELTRRDLWRKIDAK